MVKDSAEGRSSVLVGHLNLRFVRAHYTGWKEKTGFGSPYRAEDGR